MWDDDCHDGDGDDDGDDGGTAAPRVPPLLLRFVLACSFVVLLV